MKKLFLLVVLVSLLYGCSNVQDNLEMMIFKIGKADSILITDPNGTVLIDTGEDEDAEEILRYIEKKNIEQIDYLIITHFDKDHVGGADKILKEMAVEVVFVPNYESDSKQYVEFVDALESTGVMVNRLTDEMTFSVGDAEFVVFPPLKSHYDGDNDYSLVTSMVYGDNSFLFAGDAKEVRLDELKEIGLEDYDFLKVPHHGRYNDRSEEFFEMVAPEYAVITSSDKNPEDELVVEALEGLGAKVYVTRNGNIKVISNGEEIKVMQ